MELSWKVEKGHCYWEGAIPKISLDTWSDCFGEKNMASDDASDEQFHLGDELQPKTSGVYRTQSIACSGGIARSSQEGISFR